jgi:serine/threonine protein kinase
LQIALAIDISSGMVCLHAQKPVIIHCDLKPANVLVNAHWQAKVTDFGLSRVKLRAQIINSRCGQEGTIEYCAPEVRPKCCAPEVQ